jgi:phenylacetate-CoA ligase
VKHTSLLLSPNTSKTELPYINWFINQKISDLTSQHQLSPAAIIKHNLKIFNLAAKSVPAYKKFLEDSDYKSAKHTLVSTDWQNIPTMNKSNYISKHSINDLSVGGDIYNQGKIISLSSGSSGKATFWPRGIHQEIEGAYLHELLLTSHFDLAKQKTLAVVTFSMGSYLAGTYTYNSIRHVASKNYDLTLITPGINVEDCLSMISQLAPSYDQVILAGYPPFIKDLLELGVNRGMSWDKYRVKLLFASEYFSEVWRDGVAKIAGIKNVINDTTNIYGASEGTMFGWETKESIFIRREASKNIALHKALFGSEFTPTLVEYQESLRYFEVIEGRLHLTAWGGVPLVRYDLRDFGGILNCTARRKILSDFGINIYDHLKLSELTTNPMVYVSGRADLSASIYGVLIYPDNIKKVLENHWDRTSGKFTIQTRPEDENNGVLTIHVELKQDKKISTKFESLLAKEIKLQLIQNSREYATLVSAVGSKVDPVVVLQPKNDTHYFSHGIKHKWIVQKS